MCNYSTDITVKNARVSTSVMKYAIQDAKQIFC